MEQTLSRIPVAYSDSQTNALLGDVSPGAESYSRHFTQGEDFMLKLPQSIEVDSCTIHHDVHQLKPSREYLAYFRAIVAQLAALLPSVFRGLTHVFDPTEIFRPSFVKLYKYENQEYLYQLRVDLHARPADHEIIRRGDNDRTASYRTNSIIVEADFIPLDGVESVNDRIRAFFLERSVSETWIGETGRGYFVQGIWLDRDLTRFFSKLFVPPGVRAYPYFPFTCKYRAVCHSLLSLDPESRLRSLPLLHQARLFLLPHLREIEDSLRRDTGPVEENPAFLRLKESVPSTWADMWKAFSVRVYLNARDQKEFEVESGIV